ncbi:MAG: proline--tRNA ligase [Elusimicrobia bacterium]|jgi:prolyl-tRNA synthetase|nr:proline--tRNA ligase [Elusimicrobiota bacterium]
MKESRKLSNFFIPTLKEDPKEAEIPSHKLMVRAGMIRKLASGIYEFLPLGWRVVKKVEDIIRREMNNISGQEIVMSALQPKTLWDKSGRWEKYGPELMRLKDRKDREFCLGPTHEEVITHLVGTNLSSYKDLPLTLYQFQMKFRDEIRPRFGVMRAREFYMKDSYSFDKDIKACEKSYKDHVGAYRKIFSNCGLKYKEVEAATGNIGGQSSHEFMVTAETGEDEIVLCESKDCDGGYSSNVEKADYRRSEIKQNIVKAEELKEIHTPDRRTVGEVAKFLNQPPEKFIKTLIYDSDKGPVVALVRGDHELNENHLKTYADAGELTLAGKDTIKDITGAPVGFAGPVRINKEAVHKIFADKAVKYIKNAVSGANQKDYHLKNINYGRDYKIKKDNFKNLRKVIKGDLCPRCGKELAFKRGIEVGHTFLLGTKYSKSMGAQYTGADGVRKDIIMGCYGIGVTRVVAAAIEQSHDKDGIIWPDSIAPFDINIIQLSDQLSDKTDNICKELFSELSKDYEVLWDDRAESPGVKFKDAQLIGIPVQVVVGRNYLKEGQLEVQFRKSGKKVFIKPKELKETMENEKENEKNN